MIYKTTTLSLALIAAALIIVTPLFTDASNSISGKKLNELLENVENNFSKVKTLRSLLTQEKNIALFSETIISNGMCIFKSPNKLRLDYITPFKSSLIINNDQIFKYEFFDGNWQKLDIGNKEIMLLIMENITSWLQGRFKDPELYEITAVKKTNVLVVLTPKADEFKKLISSFELGLNREMNGLDYIIINETKNNYTKIQFRNNEINKEIPDIIFEGSHDEPHPVTPW
jgi:outer membrane lipoprotein-sorting protein